MTNNNGTKQLLTVYLTKSNHTKLKSLSKRMQKPMTVIVRELLVKWLTEEGVK